MQKSNQKKSRLHSNSDFAAIEGGLSTASNAAKSGFE
jgi:hypothetical protein